MKIKQTNKNHNAKNIKQNQNQINSTTQANINKNITNIQNEPKQIQTNRNKQTNKHKNNKQLKTQINKKYKYT